MLSSQGVCYHACYAVNTPSSCQSPREPARSAWNRLLLRLDFQGLVAHRVVPCAGRRNKEGQGRGAGGGAESEILRRIQGRNIRRRGKYGQRVESASRSRSIFQRQNNPSDLKKTTSPPPRPSPNPSKSLPPLPPPSSPSYATGEAESPPPHTRPSSYAKRKPR